MNILLDLLEYPKYTWKICSDLKVVSLLLGSQLDYTKHVCFLCLWDSRQDNSHYAVKVWPPRQSSQIGKHNVQHQPLVSSAHVLLLPLHIKLGLTLLRPGFFLLSKSGGGGGRFDPSTLAANNF